MLFLTHAHTRRSSPEYICNAFLPRKTKTQYATWKRAGRPDDDQERKGTAKIGSLGCCPSVRSFAGILRTSSYYTPIFLPIGRILVQNLHSMCCPLSIYPDVGGTIATLQIPQPVSELVRRRVCPSFSERTRGMNGKRKTKRNGILN